MLRTITPLLSSFLLCLPFMASQPASARPLSAAPQTVNWDNDDHGDDVDDDDHDCNFDLKICISIDVCFDDRQQCFDDCYSGLADKACDVKLGARARSDEGALAACEAEVAARCQQSCDGSLDLASAPTGARWGDGHDDDDDDNGFCVDIDICIELNK